MEVYSIESVEGVDLDGQGNIDYRSFYEINHSTKPGDREAFWYASRRPSTAESDRGSEMTLSLVDQQWEPFVPASSTLIISTLCTNREYASHLQRHGDSLGLQLELSAPIQAIHCVRAPTLPLRPMRNRRGSYWQLVSHLSLNHLSIAPETSDEAEAKSALQEILRLYNFSASDSGQPTRGDQQPPDRWHHSSEFASSRRSGRWCVGQWLLSWHRSDHRTRRGEVRRHGSVSLCQRLGAVSRTLRRAELVHEAHRTLQTRKPSDPRLAATQWG